MSGAYPVSQYALPSDRRGVNFGGQRCRWLGEFVACAGLAALDFAAALAVAATHTEAWEIWVGMLALAGMLSMMLFAALIWSGRPRRRRFYGCMVFGDTEVRR